MPDVEIDAGLSTQTWSGSRACGRAFRNDLCDEDDLFPDRDPDSMKSTLHTHIDALSQCARDLARQRIVALFSKDRERLRNMTFTAAGLHLDISKNLLDPKALSSLIAMADGAKLRAAIAEMFDGAVVNKTEKRAALHTALRRVPDDGDPQPAPYANDIAAVQRRVERFVAQVRDGRRTGHTGARFTDIVNIGIGGSHLGPQLACDALRYAASETLNVHFLANVDGGEFDRILNTLDPDATLFIVASKSFTTTETRLNATSARAWLAARQPDPAAIASHFIAVTANSERAVEFGIDSSEVYPMWDFVGGRYSMWSAIGLPIALKFGMPAFRQLLDGAAAMDDHFATAPLNVNVPVILAMLGIWNTNFLGAESYAVVPYDDRLRYLPDYLQQLEMESNGKRVSLTNEYLDHHSAPVTWGALGTNAQHAFFQLLHQGTRFIPIDFIVALQHPARRRDHHDLLVANCFAQAEGLMNGAGVPEGELDDDNINLARHREIPGNRPSTMLTMESLTPATLGALIALYEHKTFVQSVIWDINPFDQFGVELGKHLANTIIEEFSGAAAATHDPSTTALIKRYREMHNS